MLSNPCLLFADDTKIYSHIRNEYDIYQLQQDIDKLLRWSEKWQMPFNIPSAKVYTLVELTPTMFTVWLAVVLNKLSKKET